MFLNDLIHGVENLFGGNNNPGPVSTAQRPQAPAPGPIRTSPPGRPMPMGNNGPAANPLALFHNPVAPMGQTNPILAPPKPFQAPNNASKVYKDPQGNVLGWEDNTGSHLSPLGQQKQTASIPPPKPQPHASVMHDLTHNDVTNVVGGAVKFIPQFSEDYSNTFANLGNRLAGGKNQTIQQNMGGDKFLNSALKMSGANGTIRQLAGDTAQIALTAATPGITSGIEKGVTAATGAALTEDAAKNYAAKQALARTLGFVAKPTAVDTAIEYGTNALVGGTLNSGFSAAQEAGQKGAGVKDVAVAGGKGFAPGVAMGAGGTGAADLIKMGIDHLPVNKPNVPQAAKALAPSGPNSKTVVPNDKSSIVPVKPTVGTKAPAKQVAQTVNADNTGPVNPPNTEKTAVAPAGQKLSKFANTTVQNSDKVDLTTKKLVDEKSVSYTPQDMKSGQSLAEKNFGKGNLTAKTNQVLTNLNSAKTGTISRQDVFNAHKVAERLQATGKIEDKATASNIYAKLSEHHTAAGQQIQAAAALAKQSPEGMLYDATKALQDHGVKVEGKVLDKLNQSIENYKKVPEGTDRASIDAKTTAYKQFVHDVNSQIPRGKGEALINGWRANLLTGPETASKVGVSHIVTAPVELTSHIVSNAVDAATAGAGKLLNKAGVTHIGKLPITGERAYTFKPTEDLPAFAKGSAKGYQGAAQKMTTGIDKPGTGGFEEKMGQSNKQNPIEKAATRLHASLPKPNYTGEHEVSLRSQARAEGMNKGLKGADLKAFVDDRVQHPTEQNLDVANHEGEVMTNMNKTLLGDAANGIQKAPYVGKVLAPFARVPGAIAQKGIVDWGPGGMVKAAAKVYKGITTGNFDQRGFSQDIGRSLTGTAAGAVLGDQLMSAGRMTLQAPNDPKEKALWLAEGKQKNSIYVGGKVIKNSDGTNTYQGGKWISLNAFGPLGIAWGTGGSYAKARETGKDIPHSVVQSAAGGGKLVADQPYLKGVSGAANALNDPTRYAQQFYDSTVGSIVPAAVSQTARGTDTKQRGYTPGVKNTLKSEIPGQRESLPVQKDMYGNDVPSGNSPGIKGGIIGTVSPFYALSPRNQNDPGVKELQRLYDTMGSSQAPSIGQPTTISAGHAPAGMIIPANSKNLNVLQTAAGPEFKTDLNNLVNNPDYQKLPEDQKVAKINDMISAARSGAEYSQAGNFQTQAAKPGAKPNKPAGKPDTLTQQVLDKPGTLGKNIYSKIDTSGDTKYSLNPGASSDPRTQYQIKLANYQKGVKDGTISPIEQAKQAPVLAKESITSSYPKDVTTLYDMGTKAINQYLANNPNDQQIRKDLVSLDNQLYRAGLITKTKINSDGTASDKATGVRASRVATGSGGKLKTPKAHFAFSDKNYARATEKGFKAPKATSAKGVHLARATFKPSKGRTFKSRSSSGVPSIARGETLTKPSKSVSRKGAVMA